MQDMVHVPREMREKLFEGALKSLEANFLIDTQVCCTHDLRYLSGLSRFIKYVYGVMTFFVRILFTSELQFLGGLTWCTALLAGRPGVEGERSCADTDMEGHGEFIV